MHLKNKKVFITGGSAGIGKALIHELSQMGVHQIGVMGRTAQKLDELEPQFPSVQFIKVQGDVSRLEDIKKAQSVIDDQWGSLDLLINNAGVVSAGLLDDISDEDIINQVNINVTGVLLLTKHSLPLLKKSREGTIINISSSLGYIGIPFYSVYAATKSAVKRFSESLRRELAQYSIHVMTVFPNATDTDMMKSAKVSKMDSPQKVAKAAINGLLNKEIEIIFGGQKREEMIQRNREAPLKVDQKMAGEFEALRKRAEHHRSM